MTFELTVTLLTLVVALILFATEVLPVDIVALLITAVLLATGVVTLEEGIAGFANPAVVTVACMFILSAALQRTGSLTAIGRMLSRKGGGGPRTLTLLVMACSAFVSAFINNTAAVAVFLPLVFAAAAARKVSASRVLIPLSYAAQFGGVCTLIGTSTNLLVNSMAEKSGLVGFGMFEFTPLGLILCVVGGLYLLLLGPWLLPQRRGAELTDAYQLGQYVTELRVMEDSPLIGLRIGMTPLATEHDIQVIEIRRGQNAVLAAARESIEPQDLLLVRGSADSLLAAKGALKIEIEPEFKLKDATLHSDDLQLCEAIVPPASPYSGRTLSELQLGAKTGVIALAVQRTGQVLRDKLAEVRLRFGDALLLLGDREGINRLRSADGLVILNAIESPVLHREKAPLALLILICVILLAAFNVLPILVSALLGVLMLILTKCLRPEHAYEAVDWRVLVMLAGVLPLGIAMEKTGAAKALADFALQFAGHDSPLAVLAALYLLTAILTEFMSNNGAAILVVPIAISTAQGMGLDPRPFLIAVTFAASTSFATPVGYQTNTMVYNAGGYRFTDFMRAGIPLNLLFWGVAVWFIPMIWPFKPAG